MQFTSKKSKMTSRRSLHLMDKCEGEEETHAFYDEMMFLAADAPRRPYVATKKWRKGKQNGTMRHIFAYIAFLLDHASDSPSSCVLIAMGVQPGIHFILLSTLFPKVKFVLVDRYTFPPEVVAHAAQCDNLVLMQEPFTSKLAETLREKYETCKVLFACDVRTARRAVRSARTEEWTAQTEEWIKQDMERQSAICQALQPAVAMLKFRLPFERGSTSYLDGEIMHTLFGSPTTTETRLIARAPFHTRMWDHTDYEEKMFHFNTVVRPMHRFAHEHEMDGYDHCFDCTAALRLASRLVGTEPFDLAALLFKIETSANLCQIMQS